MFGACTGCARLRVGWGVGVSFISEHSEHVMGDLSQPMCVALACFCLLSLRTAGDSAQAVEAPRRTHGTLPARTGVPGAGAAPVHHTAFRQLRRVMSPLSATKTCVHSVHAWHPGQPPSCRPGWAVCLSSMHGLAHLRDG
ncbi:hypothetical protein L226DRAFT_209238 [Lentinus tigrinus ALCF2SS1-7]|uniref:uncharacterized protein n=1 Tax=Lentinus tigrinus ALCF2SS1-7 TaxID=1328758 RepID=UPI001165D059|nr:hypothetical protein L226DRAFT_209238 [Lentinus tigrinus ALCF2SS1-7]